MIATATFLLAFLIIGGGVVFLAFSGGPRGARKTLHRQGRSGSRFALAATAAVTLAFGVGIPVAVIAANSSNQSRQAPGGVKLTSAQQDGRQVFAITCAACHTLAASNAVGRVGPSLDAIRPVKALTLNAIKQGRARGMGQMPAGIIDGQDAEDVADYVTAVAGRE